MRILCTNDDGYLSVGIRVLAEAAYTLGSVDIVAPDREQSATSNSLTLHHPLRVRRAPDGAFVVDGTPTDCVILAVNEVMDRRPDLCVSGVNHGPNMGEDVLYSGTVAAAMEATFLGIPAVAFSYAGRQGEEIEGWQAVVGRLLSQIVKVDFPADTLLSINLPPIRPDQVSGVRVTTLGRRRYSESVERGTDPSGREFFWIGGGVTTWQGGEDSDFRAIQDGYISVTPLHLDLTNHDLIAELEGWRLQL
ncbi:MAG: 5'/3'-nucleotidase SurE [Longimicrobiales bacterium]